MSGPWEKYAAPAAAPAAATPDAVREQYGPAAERAARELGVSPSVVLGQWGRETGGGKSILPGTNNLGNIKDVSGKGVRARDNMTGSNDAYRAYESPDAFAADYVSLIKRKYPGAVGAGDDAQKFAAALKAGGYAEDPRYVDKLVAASRTAAPRSLVSRGAEAVLSAVSGSAQASEAPAGPWEKYAAKAPVPAAGGDYQPPKPNAMARMGRGMMDVGQGLKQLWLMGTGKPGEAEAYTQQVNDELALYDKGRGPNAGIDWMRIGGNVAATAPAMLIPGAAAPTLGARMAAGAAGGGLAGGAMFSDEATAGAKAGQVAIGVVTGAAVPAAITGGVKVVSGVVNAAAEALRKTISSATGTASPAQITVTLQQTLAQAGIDYSRLSAEAWAALYQDVKATLKAGAPVVADQIERKAAMLAVGAKPTAAQVTRDPARWAFERNTADIRGAGDRLKVRFQQNNRAMFDEAERLRQGTGGAATDAYEAAAGAIKGLGVADAGRKAAVDAAYDGARNTAGRYAQIDHLSFVQQANDALDAGMLGTYLPAQVRGLLNDVSTGKLPLNVNTAVQLDSVLSAAQRGAQPAEQKAIGIVRTALADAPSSDVLGDGARAAFDSARSLAKNRFAAIEGNPALKAALEGIEPDQFFGKFVLRGNAADLQKIGKELGTADPAAWNDIRGQAVQWLTDKATNGKGADGTFSGSALRKAMDALGTQRLKALFTPGEFAQLQTLSKAASAATETPAFTRAGIGSNTAEKLANLLGKGAGLPWVNKMVVEPVQSAVQHSAVSRSLSSLATPPSAAPLVSQQAQRAAAQRAGVASIPLSVLINGAANR